MKKMNIWIIVAVVAVLAAGVAILAVGSDGSNDTNQVAQTQFAERYETYSEEKFVASADTERVIFFHASWCPTCISHDRDIKAAGVPEGITIFRADYDKDLDLRRKYNVAIQSTFVHIDANGDVVKTWPFGTGFSDPADLYSQIL